MKFGAVIRLILMFYELAVKHADSISGYSPGNGIEMSLSNGTFRIMTGTAGDHTLSGDLTNTTLTLNLT